MTICFPLLVAATLVADAAATGKAPPPPAAAGQHVVNGPNLEGLTPHVLATRQGRVLKLDYELLDATRIKSSTVDRDYKPHFQNLPEWQADRCGRF